MTRLFVALEIPEDIRKRISALKEEAIQEKISLKWEPDEKIHLTIKFIGEVNDESVESISESLDFLESYEKVKCKLTRFGFFFKHGIPQIMWIGLWVDNILFNIVEQLNKELIKFDVPVEGRKFKPHLTLLRIKKRFPEEWVTKFNSFIIPEINFTSDSILLIKSELLPESSKYTVIKKFNLK
jgi:2'-5' RNA ligase